MSIDEELILIWGALTFLLVVMFIFLYFVEFINSAAATDAASPASLKQNGRPKLLRMKLLND